MKPNIFVLLSTCMEVPISLSCLLVHEPPVECAAIPFFASVLVHGPPYYFVHYMQWGSLKLAPTIIFKLFLYSNIFIYHKCLFTSGQKQHSFKHVF